MRRRQALKNSVTEYDIFPKSLKYDPHVFLNKNILNVKKKILKWRKKHGGIKFQLSLNISLGKYNIETSEHYEIKPWFQSNVQIILSKYNVEDIIRLSYSTILSFFDAFLHMGSGWFLKEILQLRLSIYKYNPLGGEMSSMKEIILKKRSLINIKGTGNKCFLFSVLAGKHIMTSNASRASAYLQFINELDISNLTFPVKLSQINKFEKNNNISINVFGMFKSESGSFQPYPMYISSHTSRTEKEIDSVLVRDKVHVNLLLYEDHYYLIRNLDKFIRPFFWIKSRYFCYKCLISFINKQRYDRHMKTNCNNISYIGQAYILPEEGAKLEYIDYNKQVKCPFIIYADFETYNKKLTDSIPRGKSEIKTEHRLNAFGAIMLSKYKVYSQEPFLYVGRNVIKKFVSFLHQKRAEISYILDHNRKPICLTSEDMIHIIHQKNCYICGVSFKKTGIRKVLDHAHIGREGKGRDVNYACNRCNLTYTSLRMDKLTIPILIHNSMNFDTHFIIQKLYRYIDKSVKVLARSSEKFITLNFENFHIIDSFMFLPTSLSNLANLLSENGTTDFIQTKKYIKKKELLPYVIRKGVMCYDYIDSWEKLKEKKLPNKNEFYNKLTKQHISQDEYDHAISMFKVLKCKSMKDYLKEYLKIDILLLCDVFESFREKALNFYELDPAKFLTAPALSYQAMLKYTKVKLELITDIEMYTFIESGIRGGVTNVSQRYALAEKENEKILYLDCVNLYGHSMCMYLPFGSFQWVSLDIIEKFNVENVSDTNDIGYILEVTLLYPDEVHAHHDLFPLAPEKCEITYNDLSPYAKKVLNETNIKYKKSGSKLICNLKTKKRYVLHYRNLKLYLKLGMKIYKIHRILSFRQAPWMKPYIDFNNDKRTAATSSFDKEFFKLLNNSAFGKTMENVKKRVNMVLTSSIETCKKLIEKPTFHSLHIFQKDYVGIQYRKESILLNKPIYIGFTILELSKYHMFNFHYNIMLPCFQDSIIQLLYTDTDSLIYYIKDDDYIQKMQDKKDFFDFSNLKEEHPLYSLVNKKVLGKFKDEAGGEEIYEFVALRPKMYSILYKSGEQNKRIKGIKKSTIEEIKHFHFKQTLQERKLKYSTYDTIRSFKHKVYMLHESKLSLSPFEDKRYLLEDGIKSMAYGNCLIPVTRENKNDNFFVSKKFKVS